MRLIGFLIRLTLYLILLSPIFIIVLMMFSFQDYPLVTDSKSLTNKEMQWVKTFINNNNPADFKDNEQRTTIVTERDLNILLRYASNKLDDRIQTKMQFSDSLITATGTITLPHNPLGDFVNVSATLEQQDKELVVKQFAIGDIAIPSMIANFIMMRAHNMLQQKLPEYRTALQSLESFTVNNNQIAMRYIWRSEVKDQLKGRIASTLVDEHLKSPIALYTQELMTISSTVTESRPPLTRLLQPLFQLAVQRSAQNNPIDENRAIFIVLGAYMLDKNMVSLWDNTQSSSLPRKAFYLRNREDLSRHFLVSSAITALANAHVAQAIGLDKEMSDANGGSGFSFADLAADRAGVVLAQSAFQSTQQARLLQQRLAQTRNDTDFMPLINRLPEGLQESDFKKNYKDTDSARYRHVVQVIDQRIAACRLYR